MDSFSCGGGTGDRQSLGCTILVHPEPVFIRMKLLFLEKRFWLNLRYLTAAFAKLSLPLFAEISCLLGIRIALLSE